MDNEDLLHADVTEAIIGAFYHVYNSLGVGFLENDKKPHLKLTSPEAP